MSDYSYYDDLGVSPQASRDELKAAYQERIADAGGGTREEGRQPRAAAGQPRRKPHACAPRGTCSPTRSNAAATTSASAPRRRTATCPTDDDVVDVDDDDDGASGPRKSQLTGWRKLMAPPPPKKPAGRCGERQEPAAAAAAEGADDPDSRRDAPRRLPLARDGAALRLRGRARHLLGRAARRARHHQQRLPDQGRPDRPPQLAPRRAERHRRRAEVGERRRQGDHPGAEQQQQRRPPRVPRTTSRRPRKT